MGSISYILDWIRSERPTVAKVDLIRGSILVVSPWYGPDHRGAENGVAVSVGNLVRGLRARRIAANVLIPMGDGWLPRFSRGTVGELITHLPTRTPSPFFSNPKSWLGFWLRIPLALLTIVFLFILTKPRVAHFHFILESYSMLATSFRCLGLPVVTTFRGSDVMRSLDKEDMRVLTAKIIKKSSMVTAVSNGLMEALRKRLPEASTIQTERKIIRNSCHIQYWQQAKQPDSDVKKDIDVLFIGGLIPVKGPDILVDALGTVQRKMPGMHAVFVGAGGMKDSLIEECEIRHISSSVEFIGSVPHAQVLDFYRRSRLLVLPSLSEGMPNVAIEAALAGIPVVASNVGGVPEVVSDGETGLLFPAGNSGALADAILRVLNEPEMTERLGREARERGLERFNPSRLVDEYTSLYLEVIERNSAIPVIASSASQ